MTAQRITSAIASAAETTAEQLLSEGIENWHEYSAILMGDLDGLSEDLGRWPTPDEVARFEVSVRERLQAALGADEVES